MKILRDLALAFALFIVFSVIGFMAIDSFEMEQTGSCDDCLILGDWYEWLEYRDNE